MFHPPLCPRLLRAVRMIEREEKGDTRLFIPAFVTLRIFVIMTNYQKLFGRFGADAHCVPCPADPPLSRSDFSLVKFPLFFEENGTK